jgi:hypothetical protein
MNRQSRCLMQEEAVSNLSLCKNGLERKEQEQEEAML